MKFNYAYMFEQALSRIKSVRDPHATRPENYDLKWDVVRKNALFNFFSIDFEKYSNVANSAHEISISCLNFIITKLMETYKFNYESVNFSSSDDNMLKTVRMMIADKNNGVLLFFKEIEECCFWKNPDSEPEVVQKLISASGCKSCKYIYYMLDYAFLQVVGYTDDESDPGRGFNLFSLKWFFNEYFGEEECDLFMKALDKYLDDVKNYLGYILLKSLTSNTLLSFRRVVESSIKKFHYKALLEKVITRESDHKIDTFNLDEQEFNKIKEQYLDSGYYSIALGKCDFAESFITAEWLYDSMRKAQAIDLTIIGTGYFKATEQLLWNLICLHRNEDGRLMKRDYSLRDLPQNIALTDENISAGVLDSSLGSMANFYKHNLNMLRSDLSYDTKKYILETIFDYVKVRNGYFHKHNIHDWNKIDDIRAQTFFIVFLLLGSHDLSDLSDENNNSLGFSIPAELSDYQLLCEYFNFHSNELFFFTHKGGKETIFIACPDLYAKILEDGSVKYSGLYIKPLAKEGSIFAVREDELPIEIHLAKMVFEQTNMIRMAPVKVKKVFENGKFVGPSIVDEDTLDY